MLMFKLLQNFKIRSLLTKGPFWFLFLFVISACMPKATQNSANCGTTQAFDPVTRTCYSISEIRYVPSPSLSSIAMSQETPQLVNLTYFDRNGDKAISCSIDSNSIGNNLNMASPVIFDGSIYTKESDLVGSLSNLITALENYNNVTSSVSAATFTTANNYITTINSASNIAKNSYYISTVESKLGEIYDNSSSLISLIAPYIADSSINYYYNIAQSKNAIYNTALNFVQNKCYCTGGVCTSYAIPKKGLSGSS